MPPPPRACWLEHHHPRPRLGAIAAEPSVNPRQCIVGLGIAQSDCGLPNQGRRSLPKSTSLDRLLDCRHAPISIKRNPHRHPAPAGRRAHFRPISPIKPTLPRYARRKAEDIASVKRLAHARRQVVPPGPSSSRMPSALSSLRMRSDSAKSRAALAAVRAAMRVSISLSTLTFPWSTLKERPVS